MISFDKLHDLVDAMWARSIGVTFPPPLTEEELRAGAADWFDRPPASHWQEPKIEREPQQARADWWGDDRGWFDEETQKAAEEEQAKWDKWQAEHGETMNQWLNDHNASWAKFDKESAEQMKAEEEALRDFNEAVKRAQEQMAGAFRFNSSSWSAHSDRTGQRTDGGRYNWRDSAGWENVSKRVAEEIEEMLRNGGLNWERVHRARQQWNPPPPRFKQAEPWRQVLGVTADATTAEVKAAYRKLARENHPDVNKAPDAHARMQEINRAYKQSGLK